MLFIFSKSQAFYKKYNGVRREFISLNKRGVSDGKFENFGSWIVSKAISSRARRM